MFSIIIPLYNKAAYIEKALHSVLCQTFKEFEVVVVDDGSTDNGLAVVEQLFETLTPPMGGWQVVSQQNQGVSTARNNGVKLAKYDYIAFLDADDWWESTYLEEMKGLIENFPQAGIYGSSYYKVKKGKLQPANIGVPNDFKQGLINYFQVYAKTFYMPLWTGAVVIKKKVFDEVEGFKCNLKLGEDFDLWVRVVLRYPVAFVNKPLSNYNQDVELQFRAVGARLYEPNEHMLFTDYGVLMHQPDFRILFERLAVYGLLPYYLTGKNKLEVEKVLRTIRWKNHTFKYLLYYHILPKWLVKWWFTVLKIGSVLKSKMNRKLHNE